MPASILRRSSFRIGLLLLVESLIVIALSRCTQAAPCLTGACAVQQQAAVATNFVVTQFAVPVAVPQYALPVAPASYVQYGHGAIAPAAAERQATSSNETVEDRIAGKILARLTSAGVLKSEAIPSLVRTSCVACHGGAQPKAGLDLSQPGTLTPEVRLKAIGRVLADNDSLRMPPQSAGIKLSPDDLGKLLQELSTGGVVTATLQAAESQGAQTSK